MAVRDRVLLVVTRLEVGCGATRVRTLSTSPHEGKQLSSIEVGDGLDNIDYVESRHELYAAAARVAMLTIARLDPQGGLKPLAIVPTVAGARNAVATDEGTAYLTDSAAGKVLVVAPITAH